MLEAGKLTGRSDQFLFVKQMTPSYTELDSKMNFFHICIQLSYHDI